jgi:hypothetical protein
VLKVAAHAIRGTFATCVQLLQLAGNGTQKWAALAPSDRLGEPHQDLQFGRFNAPTAFLRRLRAFQKDAAVCHSVWQRQICFFPAGVIGETDDTGVVEG